MRGIVSTFLSRVFCPTPLRYYPYSLVSLSLDHDPLEQDSCYLHFHSPGPSTMHGTLWMQGQCLCINGGQLGSILSVQA